MSQIEGGISMKERARAASEWLSSPEGRLKLEQALKRAEEVSEELRKASRLDPKKLHEPVTI